MKYSDVEISSVSDLITQLKDHISDFEGPIWFRGQSISEWSLQPRLMRISSRPPETHYFNRFKQDASLILQSRPGSEFEWLFLMQHYGVPTRLLDWSESALVALYFAINKEPEHEGALWVLQPTVLNQKNRYKPEFEFEIPSFEDEILINYLPSTIARESKSSLLPMAAIAPRNSARMQAQQGVFTISHRENILIENAGDTVDHIWKYRIPSTRKGDLLKELKLLGTNKFQLFPELDSLSEIFS
ncbi:FRG domain-containing protein [Hymenobacter sp. BT635]|uniref:FRG domain-containing protein n=1 Tax=Hymenobacter nitidus TaxID=2880929 RepID=A0ABS8AFP2_9BACT|nr:FRG domain-containing protein [Hymenobacter nitidus]MCB2379226.1 FRG domain-containing protein [Hymenobacter nitidus]